MGGHYDSEGVIWLNEPVPAGRLTDGPWTVATPEQATLLNPGEALTDAWREAWQVRDSGLVLLPGDSPATVAGLAWQSDDNDLSRRLLFENLDHFAEALPGARAVIWGVGVSYADNFTRYPELFTYTPERGFNVENLQPRTREQDEWLPAAQRRTAVFAERIPAPVVAADVPPPLDTVPEEHRRLVLAEAAALLKARHCSPESLDVVLRLVDHRVCPTCEGWDQTVQSYPDGGGVIRRCRTCNRSGTVPRRHSL